MSVGFQRWPRPKAIAIGIVAASFALLAGCAKHPPPPAFRLIVLPGFPGGGATAAFDIDETGDVVGRAELPKTEGGGRSHAVAWRSGTMVDLGELAGGGSEADRIASDGTVVGWSSNRRLGIRAVRFGSSGPVDLKIGNCFASRAVGIRPSGDILVSVDRLDGTTATLVGKPGRWMRVSSVERMPNIIASDVNASGVVVATARSPRHWLAAAGVGGRLSPLRLPVGFSDSTAWAISASGSIAGSAGDGPSNVHAVVWRSGEPRILPTHGATDAEAKGIADDGEVVGSSNDQAVVWRGGAVVNLNNATTSHRGIVLEEAVAVNDNGQIVCNGTLNGVPHGFLVVPNR